MTVSRRVIDANATWESRLSVRSPPPRATQRACAMRRHWSLEHGQHGRRAVPFGEDARRQQDRNGGGNLAAVRRRAVRLLRQETTLKRGTKCKRRACALDPNDLLKVFHNAKIDA